MEEYLQVGVITSAHGVRGEVNVFPLTDDPARFKKLKTVILDTGRVRREAAITHVGFVKNMVFLKLDGIDDRNAAEKYRGTALFITRAQAVPLEENENYIADLLDMEVRTDDGQVLGILDDVLQTGANDVYIVKTPEGKEILLPAIRDCILNVDVEAGVMTVHLLPGLVD